MKEMTKLVFCLTIIFLISATVCAQNNAQLIKEECEQVAKVFDELEYYTSEIEAIKRRMTKGYYSKEEFPYEMLDLSMRKFVKKNVTKAEFNFFTQTMLSVDNYIAAIENKLNKRISDQKMGFDNKAEQQRFQDAKLGAEKAYAQEKAQHKVDCSAITKDNSKKKQKKNKN